MSTMTTNRVEVTCLLLFGDQAELTIPGQDEPARWPAAAIADDTGMAETDLPGKTFRVDLAETPETGRRFAGFELVE